MARGGEGGRRGGGAEGGWGDAVVGGSDSVLTGGSADVVERDDVDGAIEEVGRGEEASKG